MYFVPSSASYGYAPSPDYPADYGEYDGVRLSYPKWKWSKNKYAENPEYAKYVDEYEELKSEFKSLKRGVLGVRFSRRASEISREMRAVRAKGKAAGKVGRAVARGEKREARQSARVERREARQAAKSGEVETFMPSSSEDMMMAEDGAMATAAGYDSEDDGSDNTMLYLGAGAAGLALLGVAYWIKTKKDKEKGGRGGGLE